MPRPSFPSSGSVSGAIAALGSQVIKSLSWNHGEAKPTSMNACEIWINSSAENGLIEQRTPWDSGWESVGVAAKRWFGAPVFSEGHAGFDLTANTTNTSTTKNQIVVGAGVGFSDLLGIDGAKWMGSRFRSFGPKTINFLPTQPFSTGGGDGANGAGPGVTLGTGRTALTVAAIRRNSGSSSPPIYPEDASIIIVNTGSYPSSFSADKSVYPYTNSPTNLWYYVANLGTVIWDAPSASFLQTQQIGSKTLLKSSPSYTLTFPSGTLTQALPSDLPLPSTVEVEYIASLPPATSGAITFSSPSGGLAAVNVATAIASAKLFLPGSASITANYATSNPLYLWPISYTDKLNKLPNAY
jgi:hypothetical protein